jgi:hypothetical protein
MFAFQIGRRAQAVPGNLVTEAGARRPLRLWGRPLLAVAAVLAGTVALAQPALAAPVTPSISYTNLTLINGWEPYSFSATPAVANISSIITFRGAIDTTSGNTNDVPFVLPPQFRPAKYVVVPVDMCDATSGEMSIAPDGTVEVISNGATTSATCFTSLDGASFALSTASYKGVTLQPGWKFFDNLYRGPRIRVAGGFVRFAGEMQARKTGTSKLAFILPPAYRPKTNVFIPVNLCTGSIGTLDVRPNGMVTAQPPGTGNFWMDKCGVSLDGASFALSPKSFTPLALINGWKNSPDKTAKASARVINGVVHLRGAISTKGANPGPFVLAPAFRPSSVVYITVALCDGNPGRLEIQTDGTLAVEPQPGGFAAAQCMTSLDGATFVR